MTFNKAHRRDVVPFGIQVAGAGSGSECLGVERGFLAAISAACCSRPCSDEILLGIKNGSHVGGAALGSASHQRLMWVLLAGE